jgi:RNA polymerase sigma-70 factor, ECF subfamily
MTVAACLSAQFERPLADRPQHLRAVGETLVSEADVEEFQAVRRRLFGIAYRMLGSVGDADDVVQDAWLRWQTTDRDKVRDAAAFLATVTIRLALNVAESARVRHETCCDPVALDPVDASADPALEAERSASLELVACALLERLSASECAAYVLREGFDYPYRQIAELLALSDANARQLVTRARIRLASGPRRRVAASDRRRLFEAVVTAARSGDVAGLERVLAGDVSRRRRECAHARRMPAGGALPRKGAGRKTVATLTPVRT